MKSLVSKIVAPLIALFVFFSGSSWLTTLLPFKLHMTADGIGWVGLLTTAFYGGYVLSAFRIKHFIVKIGSVKAYGIFAGLMALIVLSYTLTGHTWLWFLGRFINGFCVATVWIIIKSWCLDAGGKELRGRAMALFMGTFNSAQLIGQYLFRYETFSLYKPFSLIAMFMVGSLIVLLFLPSKEPQFHHEQSMFNLKSLFKISHTGVLGCWLSGMMQGAQYGLLAACIHDLGFSPKGVSFAMMLVVLGGVLMQMPIGRLADKFNRRWVLRGIVVSALILNALVVFTHASFGFLALICLIGGCGFVIYALSINIGCEAVEGKHLVSATTSLLVVYGLGAAIGPLLASWVIHFVGPLGIFAFYMIILAAILGATWPFRQKSSEVSV